MKSTIPMRIRVGSGSWDLELGEDLHEGRQREEDQDDHHHGRDDENDGRIDHGRPHPPYRVEVAAQVSRELLQGAFEVTGEFGDPDQVDIERRKHPGVLGQRFGEVLTALEVIQYRQNDSLEERRPRFLGDGREGPAHGNACVHEGRQLPGEEDDVRLRNPVEGRKVIRHRFLWGYRSELNDLETLQPQRLLGGRRPSGLDLPFTTLAGVRIGAVGKTRQAGPH